MKRLSPGTDKLVSKEKVSDGKAAVDRERSLVWWSASYLCDDCEGDAVSCYWVCRKRERLHAPPGDAS